MEVEELESLVAHVYEGELFQASLTDYIKESFNVQKVKDIFLRTLQIEDKEIETNFKALATECSKNGIAYSQYVDVFSFFTRALVSMVSTNNDSAMFVERIYAIYAVVKNANAKGYLFELMKSDRIHLADHIQESLSVDHVKAHSFWMQNLISDIENGGKKVSVELDSTKCTLGKWLATDNPHNYFSPEEEAEINRMHQTIHNLGHSIYDGLKNNNYHKVLIDYLMITRLSLYLINQLTVYIIEKSLIEKSQTDALTGLGNRQCLNEKLPSLHKNCLSKGGVYSLALIDVDHFKEVNDTYGHQVGDTVLSGLAKIITHFLHEDDQIYRYGGEEFLIVLPKTSIQEAFTALENLREKIAQHLFEINNHKITLTISIGLDTLDNHKSYEAILKSCDVKLYEAKELGRNRIVQ